MSESAYELLLEANELFKKEEHKEAIDLYQKVLKRRPSKQQRLIAESQLRESEMVLLKEVEREELLEQQEQKTIGKEDVQKKEERRPSKLEGSQLLLSRKVSILAMEFGTPKEQYELDYSDYSSKHKGKKELSLKSSSDAQDSSEVKETSSIGQFFSSLGKTLSEKKLQSKKVEKSLKNELKVKGRWLDLLSQGKKSGLKEKGQDVPKAPVQKKNETDETFASRFSRFEIWERFNLKHPGIDFNIAQRLESEGLTLKEFQSRQSSKRRSYLKRRKSHLDELREKNRSFPGVLFLEGFIESQAPLWLLGNGFKHKGRLLENQVYDCFFLPYARRRCRISKLEIQIICQKAERHAVWEGCRVEPELAIPAKKTSLGASKDFVFPDKDLKTAKQAQKTLFFRILQGVWVSAKVTWFDPYHIGLYLTNSSGEKNIEFVLFRHALTKVEKKKPKNWEGWVSYPNSNSDS